ncbi:GNAT family N-acetyltransferase [Streptomyces sp. SID12501]|uniref:GNAT family N-acetyltransferase n=1 Tax=Streptomyces sp. SID12501 TaxID=2706042 RepID=A0A6B3BR36_9ACTN|nr:GNAT family N-acetyltransferase [Streptomyces sp. SID12501]NEC86819.1 GNAT family N-acetyltransferase [Streptomyces sp. SID12501]
MTLVRRATPEDAAELLRLRQVMIDSMPGANTDADWQSASLATVTGRLADPSGGFAAFVVDHPERPGSLAALVVGTVEYRIGRVGYVFSVATDPDARRRGYARACMEALVDWFREQDVGQIDLTASPDAEPLYASLGFTRQPDPFMRLRL